MSLPENTTYNTLSSSVQPMAKSMMKIGQSIKKSRKKSSPDVSRYKNLTKATKPTKTNKTTPSSGSFNLGTVTTPYGGSTRYEKVHPGIDIGNKIGTSIPSFTSGTVTASKNVPGYGNYIMVTDKYGNKHRYSHLNRAYVKVGQEVGRGSVLGAMGVSGNVYSLSGGTGSHLDYRVKDLYGKYINPSKFITK